MGWVKTHPGTATSVVLLRPHVHWLLLLIVLRLPLLHIGSLWRSIVGLLHSLLRPNSKHKPRIEDEDSTVAVAVAAASSAQRAGKPPTHWRTVVATLLLGIAVIWLSLTPVALRRLLRIWGRRHGE